MLIVAGDGRLLATPSAIDRGGLAIQLAGRYALVRQEFCGVNVRANALFMIQFLLVTVVGHSALVMADDEVHPVTLVNTSSAKELLLKPWIDQITKLNAEGPEPIKLHFKKLYDGFQLPFDYEIKSDDDQKPEMSVNLVTRSIEGDRRPMTIVHVEIHNPSGFHLKAPEYEAWSWVGIFAATVSGRNRIISELQSYGDVCAASDADLLRIESGTKGKLKLIAQGNTSCGSSEIVFERRVTCSFKSGALLCQNGPVKKLSMGIPDSVVGTYC